MEYKKFIIQTFCALTLALPLGAAQLAPEQQPASAKVAQTGQAEQANKIQWFHDYSKALASAKSSNKPLLLFFTGSDWCGWCKKIDSEIFSSPEFVKDAGSSFVFVELDFPMNSKLSDEMAAQNAALKKKFGVTGFPTIVILDSQENYIAETGYKAGGGKAYAHYLKGLLK